MLKKVRQFFGYPVTNVRTRNVYSLFSSITQKEARRVAKEITNPVTCLGKLGSDTNWAFDWLVSIGYKPGVTDNLARTARVAIGDILGYPLKEHDQIFSSVEFFLTGPELSRNQVQIIACDLLANDLIQTIVIQSHSEYKRYGIPINRPEFKSSSPTRVKTLNLKGGDAELLKLSKKMQLALSLDEMKAIRAYFADPSVISQRMSEGLGHKPTDVEIEVLAQTWSEHCKHKIFDANIEYIDESGHVEKINSLYKSYIKQSTFELAEEIDWLVSVFNDNAGVIRFNDQLNLVYKVETHNSPSALDPYGGAMTGIVGVNRDPMGTGMGADLLINVWGYCFASPFTPPKDVPKGLFHPNRIRDGVHLGVIEGGNQSGIPYGLGWEYFDERFLGKPLVFCGTVGTLPRKILAKPAHEKEIKPGDLVVMAGGRIGKDGIHGATFSSEELQQGASAQVVQIGDPITQKRLFDFICQARNKRLYRFITDNGAGGLSSSVGEMAVHSNGCLLDLTDAPLKYQGLQPWEILLSESQERMTFAVPREKIDEFKKLATLRDVEVSVLGEFTATGKFHIIYASKTVAYLDLCFMHDGCPKMNLQAKWARPRHPTPERCKNSEKMVNASIMSLLRRLNICSIEHKARQYDHEVKGLSVVKPFVGVANDVESDATVFMVTPLSKEGIILARGVAPRYSDVDTYHMAATAIDLAVRRTIAVGGKLGHIAAVDNFCWPDPVESESNTNGQYKLAQLVRANKALYTYTKAFKIPCISGKDSMKNDSIRGGVKISVPPTLLFSTIAKMEDISKAVTLDVKQIGDLIYVLGHTRNELGGSEYYAMQGYIGNNIPTVDTNKAVGLYQTLAEVIEGELCHSVHTPAFGGLGVGFAKIAIAGRLGVNIDISCLSEFEEMEMEEILFSESNSRFIVTISPSAREEFEDLMHNQPFSCVGQVVADPYLSIFQIGKLVCKMELDKLVKAYKDPLVNL